KRFEREARVLAKLDHPNILSVFDYGEQNGFAYLITPYMPGGTLKELLQKRKMIPPVEALHMAAPILNALQYASERGLVHRDIKPGNMLFKADGSLVLADFGLVKVFAAEGETLAAHTANETGPAVTGTPEYMSPEQIQGRVSPLSDIYSFGIVLYEMLAGQRPFASNNVLSVLMQQVNEQPRSLREINPYISPALDAAVMHALEKDPARRYQRPVDLLQALTQAGSPGMATNPEMNSPTMATNWSSASPISSPGNPPSHPGNPPSHPGFTSNTPQEPYPQQAQFAQARTQPGPPSNPGQPPDGGVFTPGPLTPASQNRITPNYGINSTPPPPAKRKSSRLPLLLAAISLLIIASIVLAMTLTPLGQNLFGRGTGQTPTVTANPSPTVNKTVSPGTTTVVSGPPTITACPANGAGRAPVLTAMTLGNAPSLVYTVNEFQNNASTFGTLKRFDTTTGTKTEILKLPGTRIISAQLSSDGQWILFSADIGGQMKLSVVRMDGRGLQTLACAPGGDTIRNPQWSLDQKLIVFDESPNSGGATIYLLSAASGLLQTELTPPASGLAYLPRTWLDLTRVLLVGYLPNSDAPAQNIYILDTALGPNQQSSALQKFATVTTPCWNFDSSFDGKTIFYNQCTPGNPEGSSTVASQSVGSATASQVFSSTTLAISAVRVFDNKNAFLLATASNSNIGLSGDRSKDGLYKIATDGSNNAIPLVAASNGLTPALTSYSQYYWSNVSRDRNLYALEEYGTNGSNASYTLLYGSMNGGASNTFASISDGTELEVAGWTTM
ncbi:MAG TPA: protein kinase, partial [Ktedonobacterales bacterium]